MIFTTLLKQPNAKEEKQLIQFLISFEELILDRGVEMKYAPLPDNIERGIPKGCYYNCLQLLRKHPEFTYCEGYAQSEDLPLPLFHAWLVDGNGNVIDPTWDKGDAYLGIPFNTKWFINLLVSRNREDEGLSSDFKSEACKPRCLAVFESNYREEYSLLKEGIPKDAIALLKIIHMIYPSQNQTTLVLL